MNWNSCTPKECLCWKIKLMKKYLPPASETSRMINETTMRRTNTLTSRPLFCTHNHVVILICSCVFGGERWRDRGFSTSLYPSCSDTSGPKAHPQPLGLKNGLTGAAGVKLQTTDARLDCFDLGVGYAGGNSWLRCERFAHLWLLMARLWKSSCDLLEGRTSFSLSQGTVWIVSGAKSGKKFRFSPVLKLKLQKQCHPPTSYLTCLQVFFKLNL